MFHAHQRCLLVHSPCVCECIQEGALAGVGVPSKCDDRDGGGGATVSVRAAMGAHLQDRKGKHSDHANSVSKMLDRCHTCSQTLTAGRTHIFY